MRFKLFAVFLALCAQAAAAQPTADDPCVEELIQRVLGWSAATTSGRARCEINSEEFGTEAKEKVRRTTIECVFRGEDSYTRRRRLNVETGAVESDWAYSYIGNEYGYRAAGNDARTGDPFRHVSIGLEGKREKKDYVDADSSPRARISGPNDGKTFEDYLADGANFVFSNEGLDVLSHWNVGYGKSEIDIYFDELGRVARAVVCDRFGFDDPLEFAVAYGCREDEILELRRPYDEVQFSDYRNVNGIWFPCKVVQTYYHRNPASTPWEQLFANNEITRIEFARGIIPLYKKPIPRSISTIVYDPGKLALNVPIGDGDMVIRAEPGDQVWNEK